jgi:ribosomal protein L11 methyltransferase
MGWLSVSFEVALPEVEALTEALLEAGALAVDIEDGAAGSASEEPQFGEAGTAPRPWRRNVVRALIAEGADVAAMIGAACARTGAASPPYRVQAVADQDWVRATQAQFAPIEISPRLWIVPSWHAAPAPAALNIVLDPGLAFGTGSHPTTRLCLRWLERHVAGGESVIDYGCGSGILAVAALKLGAASAVGIDIDEQALLAARANALQNRVQAEFHPAVFRPRPAGMVVANILAQPLIALAPLLARLTVPGGRLALSGILGPQAAGVRAAYGRWFAIAEDARDEEWVLLSGTREETGQ